MYTQGRKQDSSAHKNKIVQERHSEKENLDLSYNFPAKLILL